MNLTRFAAGVILGAAVLLVPPAGTQAVSLLSCTVIGRVDSAYWYKEKVWSGHDPASTPRPTRLFTEEAPANARSWQPVGFLFSRLEAEDLIVKQLYPDGTASPELPGRALHRTEDSILVVWPLPPYSEVRFALINHQVRKAVISQMGAGFVALGVAAFLTECK